MLEDTLRSLIRRHVSSGLHSLRRFFFWSSESLMASKSPVCFGELVAEQLVSLDKEMIRIRIWYLMVREQIWKTGAEVGDVVIVGMTKALFHPLD